MMLRKWMTSALVAALLVVAVAGAALAVDETASAPFAPGQCTNFVDADGDGVCDNAGQNAAGGNMRRGMQVNRSATGGQGLHQSGNFVDANGDGQCDLWQDANGDGVNDSAPRDGTGNQHQRSGRGRHG
jgi:hypothetical protein